MQIIIKNNSESHHKFGRTRSEQEENLRKDGWQTLSEEQLDKCKWLEKSRKNFDGSKKNFFRGMDIDVGDKLPSFTHGSDTNIGGDNESLYARNYDLIKWDRKEPCET